MKRIYDKMIELNADGIYFHSIFNADEIICEYTIEEFKDVKLIPKSCYELYRIVDGKNVIID